MHKQNKKNTMIKLLRYFALIIFLLGAYSKSHAQQKVDITSPGWTGSSASGYVLWVPYMAASPGWSATLYLAKEMNNNSSGTNELTSIHWNLMYDNVGSGKKITFKNVDIWIYHFGAKTGFDNINKPVRPSDAVKVFSGDISFQVPNTPQTLCLAPVIFDTPFTYDGTSSLVVLLEQKTVGSNNSVSDPIIAVNTDANTSKIRHVGNFDNGTTSPYSNTKRNKYAQIKFNAADEPNCTGGSLCNTPADPTGKSTQEFCKSDDPTVSDLLAIGKSIKWYDAPSSGSLLPAEMPLADGKTYYAEAKDGTCSSLGRLSVSVYLRDTAAPTNSAGLMPSFCKGPANTVEKLNELFPGNGLKWYYSPIGGTQILAGTALKDTTYYASQTQISTGCESTARLSVKVEITSPDKPTLKDALKDQLVACSSIFSKVDTLGNMVNESNIIWYSTETGGTPLSKSDTLKTGTYYASQSFPACESTLRLAIGVTINGEATTLTKDTLTFCPSANAKIDTLDKIFGESFDWYDSQNGSKIIPGTPLNSNVSYYASKTVSGCESTQMDSVYIAIKDAGRPIADKNTYSMCAIDKKTLTDLVYEIKIEGDLLKWYDQPVGGSELQLTTELDSITYYVSQTIGDCESTERDSVVVKIIDSEKPLFKDPNLALPIPFCAFPKSKVVDLTAFFEGDGLNFYRDSIGKLSLKMSDDLENGVYYVSQKPESKCESSKRTSISVVLSDTSQPELSADTLYFCESEKPTASGLFVGNASLKWYDAINGTSQLQPDMPLIDGKTYYASQLGKFCESSLRDSILVVLKKTDTPVGKDIATFCASANPGIFDLTPSENIKWYDQPSGGSALGNQALEDGKTYYAATKIGECESEGRLGVKAEIKNPKAEISIGSSNAVCKGKSATIEVANKLGGSTYNVYSGPNEKNPVGITPYTFTPTNDTIYYVQEISTGGCEQSKPGTPVLIRVNPLPKSPNVLSANLNVCAKDKISLLATSSQPGLNFSWTGPNNFSSSLQNPTLTYSSDSTFSGKYYVRATDKNTGCVSEKSDSVYVSVITPIARFSPSIKSGFIPMNIKFLNQSINGISYLWSFGDESTSTESSPEHTYENYGKYKVYLVAYNSGCSDTAYGFEIEVNRRSKLTIPNVFTPNDDNINDVFNINGDALKTLTGKIFNRWGQIIYEWDTVGGGWNGMTSAGLIAPEGTYFYTIESIGNDGVTYSLKGYFYLIR